MPIAWPGASIGPGDLAWEPSNELRDELNRIGEEVEVALAVRGLQKFASPLFGPWGLVVGVQVDRAIAVFLQESGIPHVAFMDLRSGPSQYLPPEGFANQLSIELHAPVLVTLTIDPPGTNDALRAETRARIVTEHVAGVDRALVLRRLGDLSGFAHLEPQLRVFLSDHPDPDRNVFIMMRFIETAEFKDLHRTIAESLARHGLSGVRADDREYHPDLWSNVETCMLGCRYGVAAFEDFEVREHNPNVALELGFMRGRQKRCLILKERTLPSVPTDIVGSLYKPFDKFRISETVSAQVERWATVDLGL